MPTKGESRAFIVGLLMASACWLALILLLEIQAGPNENTLKNNSYDKENHPRSCGLYP